MDFLNALMFFLSETTHLQTKNIWGCPESSHPSSLLHPLTSPDGGGHTGCLDRLRTCLSFILGAFGASALVALLLLLLGSGAESAAEARPAH